ncbi:MAG: ExeM/NucH family extracellular endonuclease [Acidimicrobiia bacterium]|nr:ExeM/NucH family extracellular endonuclease [Acidimicrobiia bacterium]
MKRSMSVLAALAMLFALFPAVASARECGRGFTPIYDIQGSGSASPLLFDFGHPQKRVTTVGVVTVDLQRSSEHRGFFLQDLEGDGDPSTSDGIFVFHQNTWGFDVSVGDVIRVVAEIDEFFGLTRLENVRTIQVCGSASPTPTAITTRQFNSNPEQYEGMYVQYIGDHYVSDTFNLHRFGEIWIAPEGVIETPTNEFPQGSGAMDAFADDNMDKVVMLEDGSRFSNPSPVPFLSGDGTLRLGDVTTNPTGAIYYDFGNYKLVNSTDPVFTPTNVRGSAPNVGGDLTVASFNVLNYWTTLGGRGAGDADQLAAQQSKLVDAIIGLGADVVGLQEIENDHPADVPIITLIDALNAAAGSDVWSRVEGFDQNIYPIVNEIIYRNDRVTPVGDAMTLADAAFDDFRDPDEEPDDQLGRRPVAQAFDHNGEVFTVVNLHLKSKSCTGASGADLDQGDGASCYNARRVQQANAVLAWIPTLQAAAGDDDVLVVGDLNAYLMEDPITTFEGGGLSNLLSTYDPDPYSFNFLAFFAAPHIGRGTLDHAFGTSSIAGQVTDVAIWHINADEPRFLDWFDTDRLAPGPYRSSDHDPVLIGLDLGS